MKRGCTCNRTHPITIYHRTACQEIDLMPLLIDIYWLDFFFEIFLVVRKVIYPFTTEQCLLSKLFTKDHIF